MIRPTGPGPAPCPVAMDAVLCSSAGRLISAGPVELAGTAIEVQQFTDAGRPAMGHSGTEGRMTGAAPPQGTHPEVSTALE